MVDWSALSMAGCLDDLRVALKVVVRVVLSVEWMVSSLAYYSAALTVGK